MLFPFGAIAPECFLHERERLLQDAIRCLSEHPDALCLRSRRWLGQIGEQA
jgi:hypothetical protein